MVIPLLFCLYLGYAFAARFPRWLQQLMLKLLPYFSYILLIAISLEFAQTLNQIPQPERILTSAMLISFSTSLGAFACCYGLFKWAGFQPSQGRGKDIELVQYRRVNLHKERNRIDHKDQPDYALSEIVIEERLHNVFYNLPHY